MELAFLTGRARLYLHGGHFKSMSIMWCAVCSILSCYQSSHLAPGAGIGNDSDKGGDIVSSKAMSLLSRTRDGAGSHKVPRTIAGTKLDVLPNGLEASHESSDDCVMLNSDHEPASPVDGREAGPSYAPLLRAKDERREADPTFASLLRAKDEPTETVADACDASDDCMMLCSDHEQAPQAGGREADPTYAPLLRVKDERTETVADAPDASDDCIFRSNGNKHDAPHRPTDGGMAAGFKPIKDERKQA